MHPKEIKIKDFTYELTSEKIAQYPLEKRDESKLLVNNKGSISSDTFKNIIEYISENSLLIFNDTKVINARIYFYNRNGAKIEVFCLEPYNEEIQQAFQKTSNCEWKCFVGNASKWKDEPLRLFLDDIELTAELLGVNDTFHIKFSWKPEDLSFAEMLLKAGVIPLPPYMKRDAELSDSERYQTVYANTDGSVAAPTAGLHFTDEVLKNLKNKNIETEFLTLHVGAGTFKPVKAETMEEHTMHSERFTVKKTAIEKIIHHLNKNIISVGTTSLRTLESLYWLGVQLSNNKNLNEFVVSQWEPYETQTNLSAEDSFKLLLDKMNDDSMYELHAETSLIIAPGYKFKAINGLITNFHQPNSTLLLLVAAFIGDTWKEVYDYALKNDFRFLSYGDSSLLIP